MSDDRTNPEWYYVGHYGQLGPLTFEQMCELATDGVIASETYVWQAGMRDWVQAVQVDDLRSYVAAEEPPASPPPSPGARLQNPPPMPSATSVVPASPVLATALPRQNWQYIQAHLPKSDKSRVVGGLLNFIPGVGRMYLGYAAHGVLQLFLAFCAIGFVWAWIDAIYILSGGLKLDGYGRRLDE